jgi:formylglycine-generating enzyme required for sulfatase activity
MQTHPVATKAPNSIGLYDMHGNVREWALDWYKKEYPQSSVTNPTGPGGGSARVIRGGGWNDDSLRCRAAVRFNWGPEGRNYGIGFRLIRIPIFSAEFIKISPGTFEMGSPLTETNRDIDEPGHSVTLTKGFEIQKTELTQSQWFSIMGNNPSHFKKRGDCPDEFVEINREISLCPNHPVESVSWNEVKQFVDKLNPISEWEGRYMYRLPTEAEWEYAARGGTTSAYFFGDDPKDLFHHAWYSENSRMQTHPVATKAPNPIGLYDMHGNVWEWVYDWYDQRYGNDSSGALNHIGPASGSLRVARGGDWQSPPRRSRSANREAWDHLHKSNICGFRLVRIP